MRRVPRSRAGLGSPVGCAESACASKWNVFHRACWGEAWSNLDRSLKGHNHLPQRLQISIVQSHRGTLRFQERGALQVIFCGVQIPELLGDEGSKLTIDTAK